MAPMRPVAIMILLKRVVVEVAAEALVPTDAYKFLLTCLRNATASSIDIFSYTPMYIYIYVRSSPASSSRRCFAIFDRVGRSVVLAVFAAAAATAVVDAAAVAADVVVANRR